MEDGLLYRHKRDPLLDPFTDGGEGWRMVVPLEKRERVLHDSHRIKSAGHLGVDKTYDRVAREYFWPGVYRDVYDFVRTCEVCQRHKSSQQCSQGLMGKRVVERP